MLWRWSHKKSEEENTKESEERADTEARGRIGGLRDLPLNSATRSKYKRPAWRPSPEQKDAVHRAIMASQRPSLPGDALAAGCADARRLRRPTALTASHHRGVLTPLLAVATAGRESAAPRA